MDEPSSSISCASLVECVHTLFLQMYVDFLYHLYVAMFALCIGWFVQPTWPLYRANMAKAGTVGKPSVARTTRQYRQYHWSHHPSASYHAPVMSCVIRLLFPSPSPSPPSFSPLLNAVAATPPGHLLVVAVACQPATTLTTSRPPSPQHNTFFWTMPSPSPLPLPPARCPHFPWMHFSIPKGEYDDFRRVVVVQLTTQKLCEQCNDPRSNSDPGTYILQYRMRFADACSPIYSPHTVANSSVGPSPSSRLPRRLYTSMGALSRSPAYT